MIVNRHRNNKDAPKMTIYVAKDPSVQPEFIQTPTSHEGTAKAQPPVKGERTILIDMRYKHSDQILEYFMAESSAVPLKPTEYELAEVKSLAELDEQRKIDYADYEKRRDAKNREAEMLRRARAAGGMSEDD